MVFLLKSWGSGLSLLLELVSPYDGISQYVELLNFAKKDTEFGGTGNVTRTLDSTQERARTVLEIRFGISREGVFV